MNTTTEAQPIRRLNHSRDYLTWLRTNSCYGALRNVIDACFVLSLFVSFVAILAGVFTATHYSNWFAGGIGIAFSLLMIVASIASRQASLVLVDIADALIHQNSRSATNPP